MTTPHTSGAADLRTAAQAVVDRWDTPLWKDVPATAEYIGRLRAALAAGQATAAQPGVVYAELPAPNYPKSGGFPGTFAEAQMRAFADATHTLRASHGQAPAGAGEPTEQQILEAAFAPAQPAAEASRFGSPELQAMIIARCVEKDQADSVQEDAALWHWLAEYLVGPRTDLDDEIVASETVNDLRKLVKAASKQGEKQ